MHHPLTFSFGLDLYLTMQGGRGGYSAQGFAGRGGGGGASGGTQGSPQKPGGATAPRSAQIPLRPLTIKMILDAQRIGDGAMIVDGRDVGQVSLVARIVDVDAATGGAATAKSHAYRVTDGTGVLSVRHWLDTSKDPESQKPHPRNHYVFAVGMVKVFQDKPILTGTVRLVADCNEITYHFLDVISTHLRLTQGEVKANSLGVAAGSSAPTSARSSGGPGLVGPGPSTAALPMIDTSSAEFPMRVKAAMARLGRKEGSGIFPAQVLPLLESHVIGVNTLAIKAALDQLARLGECLTLTNGGYTFP